MNTCIPYTSPFSALRKIALLGVSSLAAVVGLLTSTSAEASVIDLGSAAGYSVLTYNSNNTSDSAFQGGPIGVVNGSWTQSGGAQTNTQQATTVYLSSSSFHNNGPSVETTVIDAAKLSAAWSDAVKASSTLAALAPTQTLGAINSGMTISKNSVGTYVLSISSINLNQSAITLSAPAGSTFVLNISGNVTLNGGSFGGIVLAGGLTTNDVILNLTGANSNLTTSGGGNAQQINGIVLATGANASVNLHPGAINGEVIATTFTSSSGSLVTVPPPPSTSVPEPSTFLPLVAVLGIVVGKSVAARRKAQATA